MNDSAASSMAPAPVAVDIAVVPASLSGVYHLPRAGHPETLDAHSCGLDDDQRAGWFHGSGISIGLCGEIHNLSQLRNELSAPATTPCLPLLAAAWQRWSLALLPRLDGVFSLVIRTDDGLLLYRDPSGLRHLYYEFGPDGQVAFATHLAALPHVAGPRRTLASPALHEYLRLLEVAPPNTLLAGVTALEAGQPVRWTSDHPGPRRATLHAVDNSHPANFAAAVDRLAVLLHDSVRERLTGAARPAAFLSGGIDSALLCALAAALRSDLAAVTVGFHGAAYDEAPVAGRIAAHLGLAHEVLRFTRAQYLDAFSRLSRHAEQPMADPAAMATLLAFEHCSRRFDVVLDGTGADEAVGMMPPRHVRLAAAHASRLPRGLRLTLARLLRFVPGLAGYAPVLDFDHPADTMSRWHGFRQAEIERLTGRTASLEHAQFFRTYHRFPRHAHFERYSALLNAMTCERLNQAMAISGATVRFPFWDGDTERLIRQLCTDYRYLPGEPKRILRSLLARYVPAEIWNLPKHGFNFPLHEFLAEDDHALVRRHLDAARWREHGLLRAGEVRRLAERFIAGDERLTFRVWALVVFGAWLEEHREQVNASA